MLVTAFFLALGGKAAARQVALETVHTYDEYPSESCCIEGMQYVIWFRKYSSKFYTLPTEKEPSDFEASSAYVFKREGHVFLSVIYFPHASGSALVARDIAILDRQTIKGINQFIKALKRYKRNHCYGYRHGLFDAKKTYDRPKRSPFGFWFYNFEYLPRWKRRRENIEREKLSYDDHTACSIPRQMKRERKDFNELIATLNDFLVTKGLPIIE